MRETDTKLGALHNDVKNLTTQTGDGMKGKRTCLGPSFESVVG